MCVVSRLKVIIFGAHIAYNHAWVISSYCQVGSGKYFKQLWSMTQVCAITLAQGHSSKLKVTIAHIPKISVLGHNCLLPYWIGICTQLLSLTQGYPMTLTKGHNFEVKGTVHDSQNVHPCYNFLLPCWIWIKYQTIVVHDLRGCHDLDLRSCLQGQEHSVQKFSYYLGYNFSMVFFIRMIINTHVVCNRAGIKFQLLLSDWKLICHFCLLLYPACNEQYRAFPGY